MGSKYSVVINGRVSDAFLALLEGRLRMQAAEMYRPFLDSAPVIDVLEHTMVEVSRQGLRIQSQMMPGFTCEMGAVPKS